MPPNSDIEALSLWTTSFAPLSTTQKVELLRGTNTKLRLQICNESIVQYLQRFNLPNIASTALSSASGAISTALRGMVEAFMETSHSEDEAHANEDSFDYAGGGWGRETTTRSHDSDHGDHDEENHDDGADDDHSSYESADDDHGSYESADDDHRHPDGEEFHDLDDDVDNGGIDHGDADVEDSSGGDDPNLYA